MKKIMIIAIMLGIAIFSLVYSGVLNYYGKIVGNVNVQPPVFYADFSNMPTGWKKLSINEFPSSSGEVTITDSGSYVFHTNALGISSFYSANWIFYVNAKVTSPPKTLYIELWEVDPSSGDLKNKICETSVTITSSDYNLYSATCSPGAITLNPSYGLGYVLRGSAAPTVTYTINIDGSTRIEVTKSWTQKPY